MNIKKYLLVGLTLVVAAGLSVGCSTKTTEAPVETPTETEDMEETAMYADGLYYAEGEYNEESGWKEVVTVIVKDGKIDSALWNGASVNGGMDKLTASKTGNYKMVEFGGAQSDWHVQSAIVENIVLENQDAAAVDAITGVSIYTGGYFGLVEKALNEGVKERGQYTDGAFHAEEGNFSETSGWKYTVDLTVINGNIVSVNWNGVHKDGGDDKKTASMSGAYGMVANGGASSEWHEQAAMAEAFLLEKQDPKAIILMDDGKTDAITGVTVHTNALVELVEQALTDAK